MGDDLEHVVTIGFAGAFIAQLRAVLHKWDAETRTAETEEARTLRRCIEDVKRAVHAARHELLSEPYKPGDWTRERPLEPWEERPLEPWDGTLCPACGGPLLYSRRAAGARVCASCERAARPAPATLEGMFDRWAAEHAPMVRPLLTKPQVQHEPEGTAEPEGGAGADEREPGE